MGNWWSAPHHAHNIWFYYGDSGGPYGSSFGIKSEPNGRYTVYTADRHIHARSQTETDVIRAFRRELPLGTRIVFAGEDCRHPSGPIFNRNHFLAESFRAVGIAEGTRVLNQRFQLHWNVNPLVDFTFWNSGVQTNSIYMDGRNSPESDFLSPDLIVLTTTLPTFSLSVQGKRIAHKCKFASSNSQRVPVLRDVIPVAVCRIIDQFVVEYDLKFGQLCSSIAGALSELPDNANISRAHHWVFYRERGGELDIDFRKFGKNYEFPDSAESSSDQ